MTSAPPTSISTTAVVAAPPTLVDLSVPALPEPTPAGPGSGSKSGWGKKVKPPSMVLDDDINGFRGNPKRKGGGGKKNRKVRIIAFLHEFTQVIVLFRTKMYSNWLCGILPSLTKQADRMITMSTKLGNTGSTKNESSVLPQSVAWKLKSASGAVVPEVITLKATRKTFDPERQVLNSENLFLLMILTIFYEGRYGSHDDRWSREDDEYPQGGIGSTPVTRPAPQDLNMTGDEVYRRRLAMSTGFKPAPASVATSVDSAGNVPLGAPARAETGEGAYLRRVAMSQGPPPPPSQPAPVQPAPITGDEAYQRRVALSSQQVPVPPPQPQQPSEPSDSPGYHSFTQSGPQPPSIPEATSAGDVPDFEQRVRNSRNAAAAIAAKFSAFEPPGEVKDSLEPAPEESGPGPSARFVGSLSLSTRA